MVTFNNLFPRLITFQNLHAACHEAAKGKKHTTSAADFLVHQEKEIFLLQRELVNGTYRPGAYRTFELQEYSKKRKISAAPFRDRVIHHAFCQVVEPIFDPRFIYHSFACRTDKGTHLALKNCQQYVRLNSHVFQGDIVQYFASIHHRILLEILAKKIKDPRVMNLATLIVRSWHPKTGRGVPIGNLTSQFFANLYLNELDYFIKFHLRQKHYLRYMDDFLLFGQNKHELQWCREVINVFLREKLALDLHPRKSLVYSRAVGVPFLGFRTFDRYRRVKPENIKRFLKRIKKLKQQYQQNKIEFKALPEAVRRWINHARYGDTYCLRKSLFKQMIWRRRDVDSGSRPE
ncbi:MAG: reverse transcriptase/maturase family protein [bacterium]|nr:reverse transcriptase/maturase family protein [bacterium]